MLIVQYWNFVACWLCSIGTHRITSSAFNNVLRRLSSSLKDRTIASLDLSSSSFNKSSLTWRDEPKRYILNETFLHKLYLIVFNFSFHFKKLFLFYIHTLLYYPLFTNIFLYMCPIKCIIFSEMKRVFYFIFCLFHFCLLRK